MSAGLRSWVGRVGGDRVRVNLTAGVPVVVRAGREVARGWPTAVGDGAWGFGGVVVVPSGVLVPSRLRWAEHEGERVEGVEMGASKAVAVVPGLSVGPVLFPRSTRVSGRRRTLEGFTPSGAAVSVEVELVQAGGCGCGR